MLLEEVHFLLQEGVKQQVLQSVVEPRQGALEYSSSQSREQSAEKAETLGKTVYTPVKQREFSFLTKQVTRKSFLFVSF